MRKTLVVAFLLLFAFVCITPQDLWAQAAEKKAKEPTAIKVDGTIIRHNAEKSTMDVKTKTKERVVVYNETTKWLIADKPADKKEFTDGKRVLVHGMLDDKGNVVAETISLKP